MRANLDHEGRLLPPRNVERAEVRLKQLRHEIKRLGDEIDASIDASESWHARARKNLGLLRGECLQLVRWIAEQTPPPSCIGEGKLCRAHETGAADAAPCSEKDYQP